MRYFKYFLVFLVALFILPFKVYAAEYIDSYIVSLASGGSSSSFAVIDSGTVGTCTKTVAYDNNGTNNIRYVGANPCNYVLFNGERWRIIGLFDSDIHGQAGKRLVKIVRDEPLYTGMYDYKKNNVGSSTGSGSAEWSDAEVMMMMNPTDYINTGYKADGTLTHTYTINTTGTNANYVVANSKNIYRNMGSYYNGGTIYLPAQVNNSGWNSNTTGSFNQISTTAANMIAETTWGTAGLTSAQSVKLASDFYAAERGTASYNSSKNSVKWIGKIGLLYPSEYGYATSGIDTNSRANCLTSYNMGGWSTYTECVNNNWLKQVANANATSDSDRRNAVQFTMTSAIRFSTSVYTINTNGSITTYGVNTSREVRPTLFLKDDTKIYSGSGTWSDPFVLEYQESDVRYTITYTDGVSGEVVFADQIYTDIREGATTPSFVGTPARVGYTFLGWSPTVSSTVTEDVTYTAQWVSDLRGDLIINKQVTGNLAELGEEFSFRIELSNNSVPVNQSFDYYIGSVLQNEQLQFDTSGEATIQLSSLEDITIKDILVGTDYIIEEIDSNGYISSVSSQNGTIAENDNIVTFINNKERSPLTGVFTCQMPIYLLLLFGFSGIIILRYWNKRRMIYEKN